MNFKKMFRMQMILTGLAAALLLASSAKSQEITNTAFNDGPNVAPFEQPVPDQAAMKSSAAVTSSESVRSLGQTDGSIVAQQSGLLQAPEGWVTTTFLICIGLVSLYALSEAKRANRNSRPRPGSNVRTRLA